MESSGRVLPYLSFITLTLLIPGRAGADREVEFGDWWLQAAEWAAADPAEVEDRTGEYPLFPVKEEHQCVFSFAAGARLDVLHEDGECQERHLGRHGGDYHFFVQKLRYLHFASSSACGGRSGDTTGWRACAVDKNGVPIPIGFRFPLTECSADSRGTGPNGCHTCQRIIRCH